VSAAKDLLQSYQGFIEDLTLVPGTSGVFDVSVDGQLVYSKHATGRHAEPGEVRDLVAQSIGR